MNRLALLILSLFSICYTGQTQESTEIQIHIDGLSAGKAYLIGVYADQNFRADSAAVDATGQMVFSRSEPYKPGLYYVLFADNTNIQLLIDKDQRFSLRSKKGLLAESMQVEGSLDNDLLYKSLRYDADFQRRYNTLAEELKKLNANSAAHADIKSQQNKLAADRKAYLEADFSQYGDTFYAKFKKAGQNPELRDARLPDGSPNGPLQVYYFKRDLWENVDFRDVRLLYTPVVANKLKRYITELTVQHQDSIISAAKYLIDKTLDAPEYYKFFVNWIALKYEPTKSSLMDAEAVYVAMIQNYITYERAFWSDSTNIWRLQERAKEMSASLLGKKAPNVTANDVSGTPRSIYDIKAPYIVVFMYNPTCHHCIEETPKLVSLYKEWKDKGLEVYGIALDTDDKEWKAFLQEYQVPWINVHDPTNRSIYAKYFVDITPELYVINPERKLIAKNIKVAQLEEVLRRDMGN